MIHAIVSGNLGRDPEMKQAGSASVCEFRVASNDRVRANGEWQKQTTWVRVSVFGRRGETLCALLSSGSYVTVRGGLTVREYTTRDGEKRFSVEMKADEVELGPKRERPQQPQAAQHLDHDVEGGADGDDIPF